MDEVKVSKKDLLEKLKENKKKHIKEYEEAVAGYKNLAIQEIEEGMEKLKDQINSLKDGEVIRLISVGFSLDCPENHTEEYDQAIQMLEMSVDDEIKIYNQDFKQLVMDNWKWTESFKRMSANYSKFA